MVLRLAVGDCRSWGPGQIKGREGRLRKVPEIRRNVDRAGGVGGRQVFCYRAIDETGRLDLNLRREQ